MYYMLHDLASILPCFFHESRSNGNEDINGLFINFQESVDSLSLGLD